MGVYKSTDINHHLQFHLHRDRETIMEYLCDQCGVSFTLLRAGRRHMKSVHDEERYTCDQCKKEYTRKEYLMQHVCPLGTEIQRQQWMEETLKLAYAQELRNVIFPTVVREICSGCDIYDMNGTLYDHPSQRNHDVCVMMEVTEQLEVCFEEAVKRINEDVVNANWFKLMVPLEPSAQEFLRFASTYPPESWVSSTWMKSSWERAIKTLILKNL